VDGKIVSVYRWFKSLPEDEEYARLLDSIVEKVRHSLKLDSKIKE